jgi:Triose-phosphate Transporter family
MVTRRRRRQVYVTLLPIVAGVAIASMTELTFSWVSFLNAMGSNTAFSLRYRESRTVHCTSYL